MSINFNHTIVYARDSKASATFLAEVLGLPAPKEWGPFHVVATDNGANLDFMNADGEIASQHYAFLVSEAEFDEIFGRVRERSLPFWADPAQKQLGEINHHDGGRGFYFEDRDATFLRSLRALTEAAKLEGRYSTAARTRGAPSENLVRPADSLMVIDG